MSQCLILESRFIHVFESIMRPEDFFRASAHLLLPTDRMVFGTYGSHKAVVEFWKRNRLPGDREAQSWDQTAKIWKDDEENFDPRACSIFAKPELLNELADIAHLIAEPHLVCDHIGAYSDVAPLLSFHDAFKSDPCWISADIPKERVEGFAACLGIPYHTVADYEIYEWKKKS